MAERVVDVFEAVEIEKQHGNPLAVTSRKRDRLPYPVMQGRAVGKAGQKVVLGGVHHRHRHRPRGADIAKNADRPGDLALAIVYGRN